MAAEFCTPVWTEERERIDGLRQRLHRAALFKARNLRVALTRRTPRDPRRRLHDARLRLDDLTRRGEDALREKIRDQRGAFELLQRRLAGAHPKARVAADATTLAALDARLAPALTRLVERRTQRLRDLDARLRRLAVPLTGRHKQRLGLAAGRLDALSPVAILARGYGVVLREGKALTRAGDAAEGDVVTVRLHEGELDARVEAVRR